MNRDLPMKRDDFPVRDVELPEEWDKSPVRTLAISSRVLFCISFKSSSCCCLAKEKSKESDPQNVGLSTIITGFQDVFLNMI